MFVPTLDFGFIAVKMTVWQKKIQSNRQTSGQNGRFTETENRYRPIKTLSVHSLRISGKMSGYSLTENR